LRNTRLVFQPGNQWTKDADVAIYYAVPGWWRRFIYQTLTPREFTVYTYLASVFDPNAIAYPTIEQVRLDLGIRSPIIVTRAIDRLVDLGFVLRGPDMIRGRQLSRRPVYQRPLAAYTLMRLLEEGLIDGRLFPTARTDGRTHDFTDRAVHIGLKKVLGDNLFRAYDVASDRIRSEVLIQGLRRKVAESIIGAQERAKQLPTTLPSSMSALIAEDQGVPF
jgi:DNA-binding MarR family transcriptional regulator